MEKRPPIPRPIRRAVYAFYGRACVICRRDAAVHLHHLDENNRNHVFENLIPLCSEANEDLEYSKGYRRASSSLQTDPALLAATARQSFISGQYRQAYACTRLAAFIHERPPVNASRIAESLILCISNLRPVGEPSLVTSVMTQFEKLCRSHPVDPLWKAEFLNYCSMMLFDYLMPKEALMYDLAAEALYKKRTDSPYKEELANRLSRAQKRSVFVRSALAESSKEQANLRAMLEEAEQTAHAQGDGQALGSALFVRSVQEYYHGQLQTSDATEEGLLLGKRNDFWTTVGLHSMRGLLRAGTEKKRSESDFQRATEILMAHHIKPIPIILEGALKPLNPEYQLRQLGAKYVQPIKERPTAPFSSLWLSELLSNIAA